jgi:hypothetical protein
VALSILPHSDVLNGVAFALSLFGSISAVHAGTAGGGDAGVVGAVPGLVGFAGGSDVLGPAAVASSDGECAAEPDRQWIGHDS